MLLQHLVTITGGLIGMHAHIVHLKVSFNNFFKPIGILAPSDNDRTLVSISFMEDKSVNFVLISSIACALSHLSHFLCFFLWPANKFKYKEDFVHLELPYMNIHHLMKQLYTFFFSPCLLQHRASCGDTSKNLDLYNKSALKTKWWVENCGLGSFNNLHTLLNRIWIKGFST